MSSIPVRSHTFAEIDNEIISTAILLPSADSRRDVDSYKQKYVHEVLVDRLVKLAQQKYVHEVLVNRLVKLAQKTVWFGELTIST